MDGAFAFLRGISNQWGGYGWGMHPGMGWGYGATWLWDIIMIAFWIAVIVGIIFLIRWMIFLTRTGSHTAAHGNSALEHLKVRYARGEINKAEFEQIKKDLTA